jgi:hypothetical protein
MSNLLLGLVSLALLGPVNCVARATRQGWIPVRFIHSRLRAVPYAELAQLEIATSAALADAEGPFSPSQSRVAPDPVRAFKIVLLFAGSGALFVVGLVALGKRNERLHRQWYAAYCLERGYEFTPSMVGEERNHETTCPLFAAGDERYWGHTIRGTYNGASFTAFEYRWTTGSGKSQQTEWIGAMLWTLERTLPQFTLTRKDFSAMIAELFRREDIHFDDVPEFSKTYRLRGADAAAVHALFTSAVRQVLGSDSHQHVAGCGHELMWWQEGALPLPKDRDRSLDLDRFFMEGDRIRGLFARE